MVSNEQHSHEDDTRPEADEDKDDDATPAEFIDRPENLPGDQPEGDAEVH